MWGSNVRELENTYMSSVSSPPSSAHASAQRSLVLAAAGPRSRCRARSGASGGSWCPSPCRRRGAACSCAGSRSTPTSRSTPRPPQRAHLAAAHAGCHHQPDERAPVVVHARTLRRRSRAAIAGDGGSGCGGFCRGPLRHPRGIGSRSSPTARPRDSVPLMIAWICRTVDAAIGLHMCGVHFAFSQSCSPSAVCSMNGRPSQRTRHRRNSAYSVSSVRADSFVDRHGAERGTDRPLDVPGVASAGCCPPARRPVATRPMRARSGTEVAGRGGGLRPPGAA